MAIITMTMLITARLLRPKECRLIYLAATQLCVDVCMFECIPMPFFILVSVCVYVCDSIKSI